MFNKLYDLRLSIDWNNMMLTVARCADHVMSKGSWDFAIEYYGECWYNRIAPLDTYGISNNCTDNVGEIREFAYYRISIN